MTVIRMVGTGGPRIMLGVMLACAFLSMWISNAATALMMLPIGLALVEEVRERQLYDDESFKRFSKGLMLSIAYASTIGGLATLIGSVPNAVFAAQASIILDQEVTFASWLLFAGPMTLVLLMNDMVKAGFWMNIAALIVASAFILFWQPVVLSGV